jgi:hypothetical protein
MPYDVKEAPSWPVNELGEIVMQTGRGSSNTVGFIPSNQVPIDPDTKKVVIAGAAQLALDANNNTIGIVGADGKLINDISVVPIKSMWEILPIGTQSMFDSDKTAGVTVSTDTVNLYNGLPTIRIDIPANTSAVKVGTALANCKIPVGWDLTNLAFTLKTTSINLMTGLNLLIGDASFANYYISSINNAHYTGYGDPTKQFVSNNEWWVAKCENAMTIGAGTPVLSQQMRTRINFTIASQPTAETIWIGMCGIAPKRKKPTICITLDDGFSSWYTMVRPLAKFYDIPVSLGVITSALDTNNYLTTVQMLEMYNDPSCLFDIVTHGSAHTALGTTGDGSALAQYNNVAAGRAKLLSLGIKGDGPYHHPVVETVWSNDFLKLLKDGGFLSARLAGYRTEQGRDQTIGFGDDKLQYWLNTCADMRSTFTLANLQTGVNSVIADNGFGMIIGHDFGSTDSAFVWTYDKLSSAFAWLAQQRDAGNIEIKSWTKWFADTTGRKTNRR